MSKRWQWVKITANYRPDGLPSEVHHIQPRGRRPDLKVDPENLMGVSVAEHRARHDQAVEPLPPLTLSQVWHGTDQVYDDGAGVDLGLSEG